MISNSLTKFYQILSRRLCRLVLLIEQHQSVPFYFASRHHQEGFFFSCFLLSNEGKQKENAEVHFTQTSQRCGSGELCFLSLLFRQLRRAQLM